MAVLALNTGLIPLAARAATRRTATKRVVAPKVRPRRDATRRPRAIATNDAMTTIDRDDARRACERRRRRATTTIDRARATTNEPSRVGSDVDARAGERARRGTIDRSIGDADGAYLCARDSRSIVDNRMGKQ
jgi:hypothetical protein